MCRKPDLRASPVIIPSAKRLPADIKPVFDAGVSMNIKQAVEAGVK
jgi:hypothetical protein